MIGTAIRYEQVDERAQPVLRNLYEHYLHDMAQWFEFDTGEDGSYAHPVSGIWAQGCDVFLAYSGRIPVGFALVDDAGTRVPGAEARDLKEFFVVRRHRRGGVGTGFARHVWEKYPGHWLVRVYRNNLPAIPFWQRTIDHFTDGRFEERLHHGEDGREWSYFTFSSGGTQGVDMPTPSREGSRARR